MSDPSPKDQAAAARRTRLAKALRDNLRKRKAQTRERGSAPPAGGTSSAPRPVSADRTGRQGDGEA